MSIINLERTIENNKQLVYCNLDNKVIIECICLKKLFNESGCYYDSRFSRFKCKKVKIITIYDIYKNIILKSIKVNKIKIPIKNGKILENLEEKKYCFFKTFIGAFITNNKLNDIEYNISHDGHIIDILYNKIKITSFQFEKIFNIYNNKKKIICNFHYFHHLNYYSNSLYYIRMYEKMNFYFIFHDYIEIKIDKNPYEQIIYCNKDLKIFKIEYYIHNIFEIRVYYEERNNNNEIINWKKYNIKSKIREEFITDNKNPPFSKPLKKDHINSVNKYIKNINNYIKKIKSLLKIEKGLLYNLLYNYHLEMINFK